MCPLDVTMGKAMAYYEMFLPTYSVYVNPDKTYKLWFEELIGFWSACGNNPTWEPSLMGIIYTVVIVPTFNFYIPTGLMARLAEHNPGQIDWSSCMSVIFTRVQKMFSLPVYYNKINVGHKGSSLDSSTAAKWIINTLGNDSIS